MPSGGGQPIGMLEDLSASHPKCEAYDCFVSHYDNAKKYGLEIEWMDWFLGSIKMGMSVEDACTAATMEWDL